MEVFIHKLLISKSRDSVYQVKDHFQLRNWDFIEAILHVQGMVIKLQVLKLIITHRDSFHSCSLIPKYFWKFLIFLYVIDPLLLPGPCESHLCSTSLSQLFSFLKLSLGGFHLYIGYLGNVTTELIFSFLIIQTLLQGSV